MSNHLANYTGHTVNILANAEHGTPAYDIAPSLETPARARERRRLLGFVSVASHQIPVEEVTHDSPIGLPPPQPDMLGVASLDTLRAQWRHDGNIDGYAAPDDIVRDEFGRIVGAQGVAIPQPVAAPHPEQIVTFTAQDVAALPPIHQWQNFAAHDIPLFAADTPDVINPARVNPIFVLGRQQPVGLARQRELDEAATEQFEVPVFRTSPGELVNPQAVEKGNAAFAQPEAVRAHAQLGRAVYGLVMLGSLVRNQSGGIVGGRSITIFSRRMLAADRF